MNQSLLPTAPSATNTSTDKHKIRFLLLEGIHPSAIDVLRAAGYSQIESLPGALPDDELAIAQEEGTLQRNFQGYTTHGHCDLIGLGVSAISQIGDLYCQNSSDLNTYQDSLSNAQLATQRGLVCNHDDRLRRTVIQQLICHFELDFEPIEAAFTVDFRGYFNDLWPELQTMQRDGLISLDDKGIRILPAGRLLARSVCMVFDAYFGMPEAVPLQRVRYSRTI
jgi:oxygen-independent coproporphyrinogen-3 oxidase